MLLFHFDFGNSSSPAEGKTIVLPFLHYLTDFVNSSSLPEGKAIGFPFCLN